MKKLTNEDIIYKANIIHNNKYQYNIQNYKNNKTSLIEIKCKEHGVFKNTVYRHINKKIGCPICKKVEMNNYDHNLIIDNNFSYMIGLFQTDGSMSQHSRDRGIFSLSISSKDEDIIYKIKKLIPYNSSVKKRNKKTYFQRNSKCYEYNNEIISFSVHNKYFRDFLLKCNIPYGKKSNIIEPPTHLQNFSKIDYIRGLFDGDGSLGYTGLNFPYVSFVTESETIKNYIIDFISEITNKSKKEVNRNKRDNIYNILISKEDAIKFCELVYYKDCLSLNRKYNISQDIIKWIRPENMKKRS